GDRKSKEEGARAYHPPATIRLIWSQRGLPRQQGLGSSLKGRFGHYALLFAACARVRLPGSPRGEGPEEPKLASADRPRSQSEESISGSFVPVMCRYPFIDESVRAREVTLHRRNALSADGIRIPPGVGAALGVRAGPNELRPAWTPPATTWSPRLRIFNRGEMQP